MSAASEKYIRAQLRSALYESVSIETQVDDFNLLTARLISALEDRDIELRPR